MPSIDTAQDIERELAALLKLDPRLEAVLDVAKVVPIRRRSADFAALCHIVVGQLISVAAAAKIWERLVDLVVPFEPSILLGKSDEALLGVGLSNAKMRTLRAIALEIEGGLDLQHMADSPAKVAEQRLCQIKGIGRWTSDIFLLFCAGHPDVFPSGDVALQNAVRDAFSLDERPKGKELDAIAEAWAPHRGTAARLFWSYYKVLRDGRATLPI